MTETTGSASIDIEASPEAGYELVANIETTLRNLKSAAES